MGDFNIAGLVNELDASDREQLLMFLLDELDAPGRTKVFQKLLPAESIHVFEDRVGARAAVILEAMHRASAFTVRGIEGVIAEAVFALDVLPRLSGWIDEQPEGRDRPFDFDLVPPKDFVNETGTKRVKVQVKMQRRKSGEPMTANAAYRRFSSDMWVVETQKSRAGEKDGASTRPYRFGEFDVLAVSMKVTKGKWSNYMYTVADWLISNVDDPQSILKFQPIPSEPNEDWTDDFLTVVEWFQSSQKKTIGGVAVATLASPQLKPVRHSVMKGRRKRKRS